MPLRTSLEQLVVKWKFRSPLPDETPLAYKTALATHVFDRDRIEAMEIMRGAWDNWNEFHAQHTANQNHH